MNHRIPHSNSNKSLKNHCCPSNIPSGVVDEFAEFTQLKPSTYFPLGHKQCWRIGCFRIVEIEWIGTSSKFPFPGHHLLQSTVCVFRQLPLLLIPFAHNFLFHFPRRRRSILGFGWSLVDGFDFANRHMASRPPPLVNVPLRLPFKIFSIPKLGGDRLDFGDCAATATDCENGILLSII